MGREAFLVQSVFQRVLGGVAGISVISNFSDISWSFSPFCQNLFYILSLKCFPITECLSSTHWWGRGVGVAAHVANIKAGFHLKAVFMSFNVAFVPISRSRFKQCQIAPLRTFTNVLRFCVNFWMIFGHSVNEIFFSKDRLKWGKYEVLKIWWIWKIEFWSEELIDGHQTVPYKPGALFRGVQLSGRVPNPF